MCCIHVFSMQGKILVTAGTKTTPKSDGPLSDDGNFNQEDRFILHGNSCINWLTFALITPSVSYLCKEQ